MKDRNIYNRRTNWTLGTRTLRPPGFTPELRLLSVVFLFPLSFGWLNLDFQESSSSKRREHLMQLKHFQTDSACLRQSHRKITARRFIGLWCPAAAARVRPALSAEIWGGPDLITAPLPLLPQPRPSPLLLRSSMQTHTSKTQTKRIRGNPAKQLDTALSDCLWKDGTPADAWLRVQKADMKETQEANGAEAPSSTWVP